MNIIHCAATRRSAMANKKLIYPAAERNKNPILSVLQQYIRRGPNQILLEIASGTGQHVAHFAPYFPHVTFYPSELEDRLLDSISAYSQEFQNIANPTKIDITTDYHTWPGNVFHEKSFDYIFNACLVHIAPFKCAEGLFKNTGQLLKTNGIFFMYGPYALNGLLYPESNINFDQNLRSQNPEWGIRDITDLKKLGNMNGIQLFEMIDMPQNNKTLVWQKVDC